MIQQSRLGMDPRNTIIQKESCITVFTVALFTIARTWKQPKCPSTDEWIKKMWHCLLYTSDAADESEGVEKREPSCTVGGNVN